MDLFRCLPSVSFKLFINTKCPRKSDAGETFPFLNYTSSFLTYLVTNSCYVNQNTQYAT